MRFSSSVAITTTPRQENYIRCCYRSFLTAGWDPQVFDDVHREGLRWNFFRSTAWLLKTRADILVCAQDDCVVHPQSKEFLEELEEVFGDHRVGFLSMWTPPTYVKQGFTGLTEVSGAYYGGVALAFRRECLEKVVNHEMIQQWPHKTGLDVGLMKVINELGFRKIYINPSIAEHVGEKSSLGHGNELGPNRVSASFAIGDLFDMFEESIEKWTLP